jgi:hypothetical protein
VQYYVRHKHHVHASSSYDTKSTFAARLNPQGRINPQRVRKMARKLHAARNWKVEGRNRATAIPASALMIVMLAG